MTTSRPSHNFNKNQFENNAWNAQSVVIGLDEVGRGCLAGPLVAAAVILPPNKDMRHLKDSKIMTEEERIKAARWIRKHCLYSIGIVHNRIIDKHNIWQATLITMRKAAINILQQYPHQPAAILVDAMPLSLLNTPFHAIPIHHFPRGESKSSSIAAASIIAKVMRDELMHKLDSIIPGYHLASNKGYATKSHYNGITAHKYSIIHRMTFLNRSTPIQDIQAQLNLIPHTTTP